MIEVIVAAGLDGAIGKDNKLLWNLKDDMAHFVKTTMNKNVVMGRKTFESLPNGPLRNRHNYVLTNSRKAYFPIGDNTSLTFLSYDDLMLLDKNFVVIGGSEVYKLFMANADIIHCTLVFDTFPQADTFIPTIEPKKYDITEEQFYPANERNDYPFNILKMIKR